MKKYVYKLWNSPYQNSVKAKNLKEAKEKIKRAYPEYNIDKVLQYLVR
jgi:hypothetical protein